jgi:biotin operon repressor
VLYQRSFAIEKRLDETIDLIRTGHYSTPTLAAALKVSIPTVSRCITALRERGYDIQSIRGESGWHYVLMAGSGRDGHRSLRASHLTSHATA